MSKTHKKKLLKNGRVSREIATDPAKMITAAEAEKVRQVIRFIDDFYELVRKKKGWPGYPVRPGTVLNKTRRQMVASMRQLRKASVKMETAINRDVNRRR